MLATVKVYLKNINSDIEKITDIERNICKLYKTLIDTHLQLRQRQCSPKLHKKLTTYLNHYSNSQNANKIAKDTRLNQKHKHRYH